MDARHAKISWYEQLFQEMPWLDPDGKAADPFWLMQLEMYTTDHQIYIYIYTYIYISMHDTAVTIVTVLLQMFGRVLLSNIKSDNPDHLSRN